MKEEERQIAQRRISMKRNTTGEEKGNVREGERWPSGEEGKHEKEEDEERE